MPRVHVDGLCGGYTSNIPAKFFRLINATKEANRIMIRAEHPDADETIVLHDGYYQPSIVVEGRRIASGRIFAEAWYIAASQLRRAVREKL